MPQTQRPNPRPRQFEEIVGNRQVIDPLTRAIARGMLPNLLLFTGPTGAGKTTIARIVARRILCQEAGDGTIEPCGSCQPCACNNLDSYHYFEEVDAATPSTEDRFGLWKLHDPRHVYFIDEVQELPRRAMVRLRKMVEDHFATVILATTHYENLDDALVNRVKTSRYELQRPTTDEIADYFERRLSAVGGGFERRDQLIRVADHYQCEMRPCANFVAKVLGETEAGVISDAFLDELFGPQCKLLTRPAARRAI